MTYPQERCGLDPAVHDRQRITATSTKFYNNRRTGDRCHPLTYPCYQRGATKAALTCDKRLRAADEEGPFPQREPAQHHSRLSGPLPPAIHSSSEAHIKSVAKESVNRQITRCFNTKKTNTREEGKVSNFHKLNSRN